VLDGVVSEGLVELRPGDDDPGAIALMQKLSVKSRKRWPDQANPAPALVPPPKKRTNSSAP
jgi:coenzyme F420 hydrogenase subunit beta